MIRSTWLPVAALALVAACGSGAPDSDAQLSTVEQSMTACPRPLCSEVCSCATSCATECCTNATETGIRTTCGARASSPCPGKLACTCGNGVCDGTETSANCEKDCPECATGGTDPNGCGYSCTKPAAGEDRDADLVPDQLEYLLAHKFFPNMLASWEVADRSQFYANDPTTIPYSARLLGQFTTVGPCAAAKNLCIQITYGMAYHRDCGDDPDPTACNGLGGHLGDSEFYIAVVKRTTAWETAKTRPSAWQLIVDFTSAHFGTDSPFPLCGSDSSIMGRYGGIPKSCFSMYGYDPSLCNMDGDCQMNYMSTPHCENRCSPPWAVGSAPLSTRTTLYVSEGKHANYHSLTACENGAFCGLDSCPNHNINLRNGKKCHTLQNVGNSANDGFKHVIHRPGTTRNDYDIWNNSKDNLFGSASPYYGPFTMPLWICMQQ
jgi:hypothetical protein